MADFSTFSTRNPSNETTEEIYLTDDLLPKFSLENKEEIFLFHQIDLLNGLVVTSVIYCVGIALNILILRCYWSVKTSTAVYIRVLAIYDILMLHYLIAEKISNIFYPVKIPIVIEQLRRWVGMLILQSAVLGPLFMALDRMLMVTFPHTFNKHDGKMRIVKILIAMLQKLRFSIMVPSCIYI